jgi:hypothetical protein
MTRFPTSQAVPAVPRSVVLGELAIAAGIAGRSITLLYQDYSGPALCEMWKYLMRGFGPDEVLHVRSQADVRSLGERLADIRNVLIHAPHLHATVAWCVQMGAPIPGEVAPRPSIFAQGVPGELEGVPGAALMLRCNSEESAAITRWSILAGQAGPEWENLQTPTNIRMYPALVPLLAMDSSPRAGGVRSIRDRQVLQSLLVGAGLRRSCRQASATGESVAASLQDYELVRRLLQSRLVASADVPVDQMAVDMVNRTNVYLAVKYGPDQTAEDPFQPDEYYDSDRAVAERPRRPLVTRREVADLGNVRSGIIRRLIQHLQRRRDGYEMFGRMGIARRQPEPGEWMSLAAGRLASLLRPWTVKQVRSHFEWLHKAGLITAEREPRNGPWRYLLPEEFSGAGTAFGDLPPADQLPTPASGSPGGVTG